MVDSSHFADLLEVQLGLLKQTLLIAHCDELERLGGEAQDIQGALAATARLDPAQDALAEVSASAAPRGQELKGAELECCLQAAATLPTRSRNPSPVPSPKLKDVTPPIMPPGTLLNSEEEEPAVLEPNDSTGQAGSSCPDDANQDTVAINLSSSQRSGFDPVVPTLLPASPPPPGVLASIASNAPAANAGAMFEVKGAWLLGLARVGRQPTVGIMKSSTARYALMAYHGDHEDEEDNDFAAVWKRLNKLMVAPNSLPRLSWDMFGMLLIAFDFVDIPLLLLDPPETAFTLAAVWVARLFWLFDIFATFLTGALLEDGIMEMRSRRVARRYARSWLAFDVILVAIDWAESFVSLSENVSDQVELMNLSRTFRMLRMLRLARVIKLSSNMAEASMWLSEVVVSEQVGLFFNIFRSTLSLGLFAHVTACCWYRLGTWDPVDGWVARYGFDDKSLGFKYAVSVHWAMTQIIGAMDVVGQTLLERLFAVGVLLTCFVMAGAFVSTITTSMTRLDFLNKERHTQLSLLRRYLWGQGVSTKLSMRITRNALHVVKERSRNVQEVNVAMLDLISEPLRIELHFEVHSKIFHSHPLFCVYYSEAPVAMRQICHKAVRMNSALSKGDVLFSAGERPERPAMLFFVRGELKYGQELSVVMDVMPGEWACEPVLWTTWIHRGVLQAQSECSIMELDAAKFVECMGHAFTADSTLHPARYAAHFVSELNDMDAMDLSDLDMELGMNEPVEEAFHHCRPMKMRQSSLRTPGGSGSMRLPGSRRAAVWRR